VSLAEDRRALEDACARLEKVARALADTATPVEDVKGLAEQALALSADITERLPRVLREAEAAAEGHPLT
jgi:hypothetical protein